VKKLSLKHKMFKYR